jgi:hypothetical protein
LLVIVCIDNVADADIDLGLNYSLLLFILAKMIVRLIFVAHLEGLWSVVAFLHVLDFSDVKFSLLLYLSGVILLRLVLVCLLLLQLALIF